MENEMIVFEANALPPSENNAIRSAHGHYYPTKEYRDWKAVVALMPDKKIKESQWYEVERIFYMPLYCKNGNVKRTDTSNYNKYSDDEFCRKLGIDDSHIINGHESKVDCLSGEERTIWTIWAVG